MTPVRFTSDLEQLLVPIESVFQHPLNPNATDLDELVDSIRIDGFHTPVVAQHSTRLLLDGNQRYAALLALGATHIPVSFKDVDDAGAYRILMGANRLCRLGRDDPAMVLELADMVINQPLGLAGTGWNGDDIDDLRALIDPPLDLDGSAPVKQRGKTITCPSCGHEFGGSAGAGRVTPASEVYG